MDIFFIGSGNVATHLATSLRKAGHSIVGICGRNADNSQALAQKVDAKTFTQLSHIPVDASIYLICISDDNIADVASQMPLVKGIVAHTAGSVGIEAVSRFSHHGVFYPLQSFSKNRDINLSNTPFCIESGDTQTAETLKSLASDISNNVHAINTDQRRQLHLSAVFASNFANCMYAEAEQIMQNCGLPFNMLEPLVMETASKAFSLGPTNAQTGPARRGDMKVMDRQRQLLPTENLKKMYSFVSQQIQDRYSRKD